MEMGIPRGPAVGAVLSAALDAVIDESVENERESLRKFVSARFDGNGNASTGETTEVTAQ